MVFQYRNVYMGILNIIIWPWFVMVWEYSVTIGWTYVFIYIAAVYVWSVGSALRTEFSGRTGLVSSVTPRHPPAGRCDVTCRSLFTSLSCFWSYWSPFIMQSIQTGHTDWETHRNLDALSIKPLPYSLHPSIFSGLSITYPHQKNF